ncbi:MAG: cytidine deaminase [Thermoprotei archaeon]|nr:cytidine deaminase [Thermoprotei archaeon]
MVIRWEAVIDKITEEKMLSLAKGAIKNSYAPYSGFRVSAVVLTPSGKYYTGVNVENVSYGLTMCAERVAVYKAVSEGEKKISAVLIYAEGRDLPYPCGACRQVIAEFGYDSDIIVANSEGKIEKFKLSELLPKAFLSFDKR